VLATEPVITRVVAACRVLLGFAVADGFVPAGDFAAPLGAGAALPAVRPAPAR
jgi:hypothetical protein